MSKVLRYLPVFLRKGRQPCRSQGEPSIPNDLELMRAAFNKVCDRLELQCRREDPLTELLVDAIIDIAATGERDPDRLCERVLLHLKRPQREVA
jgi:hypothetical protein